MKKKRAYLFYITTPVQYVYKSMKKNAYKRMEKNHAYKGMGKKDPYKCMKKPRIQ